MEAENGVPVVALEEIDSATSTGGAVGDPSDQTAYEVGAEVSTASGVAQPDPPVGEDGTGLSDGADECAVCLCVLCEPVELGCGHTFWCVPHHLRQTALHTVCTACALSATRYAWCDTVPVAVECVPSKHCTIEQLAVRSADPHILDHSSQRTWYWRRAARMQSQASILQSFSRNELRQPKLSVRLSRKNSPVDESSHFSSCMHRASACAAHLRCICLSLATAGSRLVL
jgi:hypothetical protein